MKTVCQFYHITVSWSGMHNISKTHIIHNSVTLIMVTNNSYENSYENTYDDSSKSHENTYGNCYIRLYETVFQFCDITVSWVGMHTISKTHMTHNSVTLIMVTKNAYEKSYGNTCDDSFRSYENTYGNCYIGFYD